MNEKIGLDAEANERIAVFLGNAEELTDEARQLATNPNASDRDLNRAKILAEVSREYRGLADSRINWYMTPVIESDS
jgi:hypothetical protein